MTAKEFIIKRKEQIIVWGLLFGGGAILRIMIAIFFSSGLVHPDEIFQSREIAHSWLYPKIPAIIPWEFKDAEIGGEGAARSIIFPLIVYLVMFFCDLLNLNYWNHTLLILRAFFALVSSILIPAIYYLARELFTDIRIPYLASFLTTIYYLFPYFGVRSLTNSFYVPFMVIGWYFFLVARKKLNNYDKIRDYYRNKQAIWYLSLSGILFGFCFSIRIDSLVFVGFFFLIYFNFSSKIDWYSSFIILLSFSFVIIIQGISDLLYYGTFLISGLNWFIFNIVDRKSSKFGVSPGSYYIFEITKRDFLLLIIILCLLLLWKILNTSIHNSNLLNQNDQIILTRLLGLAVWFFGPTLVFSLLSHKEFRFIFGSFPAFVILAAFILSTYLDILIKLTISIIEILSKLTSRAKGQQPTAKTIKNNVQPILLILLCSLTIFLSIQDGSKENWNTFGDVFHAMEWVGQQNNSTGVFVFTHWFWTGGYSSIHKNITLSYDNDITRALLRGRWRYDSTINYLICPHYQYFTEPNATTTFSNYGFNLIKVVDNKADVFYKG